MDELKKETQAVIDMPPVETPATPAVCVSCGAMLKEGYMVCPQCGTPVGAAVETPVQRICRNCGAVLEDDQNFCPKCGQNANQQPATSKAKKSKRPLLIGIVAAVIVVVIAAIVLFVTRDTPVDSVTLREKELTLAVGEHSSLVYTVAPDDATDPTVTWTTSNESKATVEDGTVYAVEEGTCTITVSSTNGKEDTCYVTIESAGPDLEAIYEEYCDPEWASLAGDGSYLSIDTNPDNKDDYTDYAAYLSIAEINTALGLPESLFEKIGQTRSLDGRLSESYDDLNVSWTYHPDNGLEIMYEKK